MTNYTSEKLINLNKALFSSERALQKISKTCVPSIFKIVVFGVWKLMIPVNQAQEKLQELIDSVRQSHQPIVITGSSGNAVLVSEADWASVQETLYLLSIPGMRESIREGLETPVEECSQELDW